MVSTVTPRLAGFNLGAAIKAPCDVATTGADITLSATQTVDGIAVGSCERVLVKDQTDASENGIYLADSSTWVRAQDFDGSKDALPGTVVYVRRGTNNGNTFFGLDTSSTATSITIGSNNSSFVTLDIALANVSVEGAALIKNTSAINMRSTLGFPTTSLDNALLRANATAGIYQDSTWTLGDNSTLTAGGPLLSSDIYMADAVLSRPKLIDYGETVNVIGNSSATAIDIDLESGNVHSVTLISTTARNFTFSNPPASTIAGSFTLLVVSSGIQDTPIWTTPTLWPNGSSGVFSSGGIDVFSFFTITGGTTWYGFRSGADMS